MTIDEILNTEMLKLVDEITEVYEQSGRKASGQFAEGLSVETKNNTSILKGYTYLAGRGKTRNRSASSPTLQEAILQWIKDKPIVLRDISEKSFAYIVARNIHKRGTDPSRWLKIYEQVLTEERIQEIINNVSNESLSIFVEDITLTLKKGV